MAMLHRGKQSMIFDRCPSILATAAIGGKKEQEGPLAAYFDYTNTDTKCNFDAQACEYWQSG